MTRIEPVDCTVLIVDDHPSFRASARVLLESEGFNVIGEAVDGASAVEETCRLQARSSSCSTSSCPISTASTSRPASPATRTPRP